MAITQINAEIEKKILDHHRDNYITTQEFNKLMSEDFAARLLVTKTDVAHLVKRINKKTE